VIFSEEIKLPDIFLLFLYGTIRYHTFGPMLKKKKAPFNLGSLVVGVRCFCLYTVAWVARRSCPSLSREHGRGAEIAIT
jgi:hypothetical protein